MSFDVWCKPCWVHLQRRRRENRARQLVLRGLRAAQWVKFNDLEELHGTAGVVLMGATIDSVLDEWEGLDRSGARMSPRRQGEAIDALRGGSRRRTMGVAGAVRAAVEEVAAADALCTQIGGGPGWRADVDNAAAYRRAREAADYDVAGLVAAAEAARGLLYAKIDTAVTPPPRRPGPAEPLPGAEPELEAPQERQEPASGQRLVEVEGLIGPDELAERVQELREQLRARRRGATD